MPGVAKIVRPEINCLGSAEFLNDRGRRDVVDYRVRWMDANGVQVAQYDPWVAASLEGKESSLLNFTAPRPEATDFRIEIKTHY